MRLLAVGDIHGCFQALTALEAFVPFTEDDLLVTLGDYVDRGPDSYKTVEWVRRRTLQNLCIPIRGNHEIMMVGALKGESPMQHWMQFGGREAVRSYTKFGGTGTPQDIPVEHLTFLERGLRPYFETESHIFVHATADAQKPMDQQPESQLYWERFESQQPHVSGKVVICGHTAQKSGVPADVGYAVCIDTWAYGAGWLTCLDVMTGEYWQANQQGQTRRGRLVVEPME